MEGDEKRIKTKGNEMRTSEGVLSPEHVGWRWKILIATYVGYIGYYLTRTVFAVVKADIGKELGVGAGGVAPMVAAFYIAYMLGLFLTSVLCRRTSARFLLLGGLGASIVVNVFFATRTTYAAMMVLMIVNGFVQ